MSAAATLRSKVGRPALVFAAALAVGGCGNQYRPVVSAINPIGPAGQPTKYAVAISSPSPTSQGIVTLIDFSGDTILNTTLIGVNPQYFILAPAGFEGYTLNGDGTLNSFSISSSLLESQVLTSTLLTGSTPISLYPQGSYVYIAEGSNVAQLAGLPPAVQSELPTGANTIYTVGASSSPRAYALSQGTPGSKGTAVPIETVGNTTDAPIPVGIAPTYGVMSSDSRRAYILNKGSNSVTVINAQSNALDSFCIATTSSTCTTVGITGYSIAGNVIAFQTTAQTLTAGQTVELSGFPTSTFLNSATFTVLPGVTSTSFTANYTHTAVAATTESGTGTLYSSTVPVGIAPVWADFAAILNEVVILNQGNGTGPGSVSIISNPLCSQVTVVGNPNCDSTNPIDAVGFGQVVATIPVGVNPVMISCLSDGTQCFVANSGNSTTAGSVSVINLSTNTVVATIPGANSDTNENDLFVHGHPNYIAATTGTPTGKVYVTAPDSTDITIIRTDLDAVTTHLTLSGAGVSVRVTAP